MSSELNEYKHIDQWRYQLDVYVRPYDADPVIALYRELNARFWDDPWHGCDSTMYLPDAEFDLLREHLAGMFHLYNACVMMEQANMRQEGIVFRRVARGCPYGRDHQGRETGVFRVERIQHGPLVLRRSDAFGHLLGGHK